MSSPIISNLMSNRIRENMRISEKKIDNATRKLSSGKRFNGAWEDNAGIAIAVRMGVKESGLKTASRAMGHGLDMLQTADSAYGSIQGALQSMADTALMATNGTWTQEDKDLMAVSVKEMTKGVEHIANSTIYNGHKLLSGDPALKDLSIPISEHGGDLLNLSGIFDESILDVKPFSELSANPNPYFDPFNPEKLLTDIKDFAMEHVNEKRTQTGAKMVHLEHAVTNANNEAINTAQAASRISDADMAKEMSELTKGRIITESGISMLSQSKARTESILKLFD